MDFRTEYFLHNTAAGKAILAEMDRARAERILDTWQMPQESEATILDRDHLFETLDDIAARGYATLDEESAPGLVAVGVPVRDDENIVGGLSVGGPKYRIDMHRLHNELADCLLEAAESIERHLQS